MEEVKNMVVDLFKTEPGLFPVVKSGDLIEGKILDKSSKMILVDLGQFGTGAVYKGELANAQSLIKDLKEGDKINAKVIDADNEDGYVELSLAAADKQKAWGTISEIKEKDEPFSVKVKGSNKGGFMTEINGVPAFLPTSQLNNDHLAQITGEDKSISFDLMKKFIGTEVMVKIIDLNPRNNKLILSERAAEQVNMKELAKNYSVGQMIDGVVSGIADFGVFIKFTDNPEVEGLIHISELSHNLVSNPKEVVNVDDVLRAKIIEINEGKISLSLKSVQENPWENAVKYYKEGDEITGVVYALNPFGAIISLGHDLQGQVHVSEFGGGEEMKRALVISKKYDFVVGGVSPDDKRIILKIKK